MDFACSVKLQSMFHGADCASYCLPNRMISARLYPKGLGSRFFDPKIDSKVRTANRLKRSVRYRGSLTLNASLTGRFYGHLLPTKPTNAPLGFRLLCHGSDSVGDLDGNDRNLEFAESSDDREVTFSKEEKDTREQDSTPSLEELRDLLHKATKELEVASLNSTMFEEKAQRISEVAIALKDEAASAWNDVNQTLNVVQETVDEECVAKEAVQKATMALSLAEARLQVALESLEASGHNTSEVSEESEARDGVKDKEEALLSAKEDIKECQDNLASCEDQLRRLQIKKDELQKEVDRLNEAAERAQINALKAEEDVANIMILAEQAVAFELEATQRVNDAEIALQRAEKSLFGSQSQESTQGKVLDKTTVLDGDEVLSDIVDVSHQAERELSVEGDSSDCVPGKVGQSSQQLTQFYESSDNENGKPTADFAKEAEAEAEKSKNVVQTKKQEVQKDLPRESSSGTKASLKKSSRFFPASFFSSNGDGTETVFDSLFDSVKQQWPKLILGFALLGAGVTIYSNRVGRNNQLPQLPNIVSTSTDEVSSSTKPLIRQLQKLPKRLKKLLEMLPQQEVNEEEASLLDVLWLLLASVIFVPLFQKIPGGSPVLGYLAAGILIGPYGLSIIRNVHGTKAIAEFGVVFLLFNIGLELSVERLSSMKKYVFGLGSAQVLVTAAVVGLIAHYVAGQAGPAAIVIGNGLALSSTAVVLQVLQERGESTSRHGRATFSVLLFQDLAVVVLLILIPLISPNSSKGGIGFQAIAEALGLAAIKAAAAITAIIAGGRLLLRPIYKQIAENRNAEIFSANTLLVILGTSLLTARAGLSMALGAFLAGLLLAETEFSLQVESDIAPYRGLLLGLFFMTVGMSIDPKLLLSNFPVIMGTLGLLLVGKTILVAIVGKLFGISIISAVRVGLLLAPGGEFAFVAFGEAVNQGIMTPQLSSLLFLVVGISMAVTPWLAAGGQLIASRFELQDVRSLLPVESETDDLQDHIIICGFGRVGQIIAQLLSERLIPFVALDVSSDRVAIGRSLDLPVYFGDAGSREVLHKIGAERACAAAIALDTPGANYRCVWALSKYFPNVKTFVRAHDVDHGLNLEKAGATAVVPETLEPSLQLAAAVLAQAKLPTAEIATTINEFRTRHLSELTELCEASGSSLGYGFSRSTSKPKSPSPSDTPEDNQIIEGTLAI
ncbi:K(+) efflux antiporter 2 [Cardamine amara subsp. amara]|uniref:K(+) efflux antiporter 2 n=1 Tax=Cardamine amara subsp. amara TaxID=228776 RepID=A0ABD1AEZ8_CARAN